MTSPNGPFFRNLQQPRYFGIRVSWTNSCHAKTDVELWRCSVPGSEFCVWDVVLGGGGGAAADDNFMMMMRMMMTMWMILVRVIWRPLCAQAQAEPGTESRMAIGSAFRYKVQGKGFRL